ncbi:uncharacterized protein [Littorina saxatilis]|uniref:SUEL-type lectin domain-containing protein n=1 Tax=Littorina saxatilis TaxID=31220 RepID=A0AAN9BNJ0_9CAEN
MRVRRGNAAAVVCYFAVFVWIGLFLLPSRVLCKDYTEKVCPGGQEGSPPVEVTLTCPAGQVVSLGEAIFGRNKYGACTITAGDCKDTTDAFEACEGRYNCTVHFDRPLSPNCGFATFIIVSYDCQKPLATPPPIVAVPTSPRDVDPGDATVNINVVTDTSRNNAREGTKKSNGDNIGLIVGCVLAVIVTIILLIIAIVMVVRRLACATDPPEDEEKKSSACHILTCVGTAQDENGTKSEQTTNDSSNPNTRGNEDNTGGSKRNRKQRGRRADKNQNMSPRLAPVGQEDAEEMTVAAVAVASQSAPVPSMGSAAPDASSTGEPVLPRRSSARSSLVMETSQSSASSVGMAHPVKRHSSGAKVVCGVMPDFSQEAGPGGGSGLDDVMRRGSGRDGARGGGGGGGGGGGQVMERGIKRSSWGKEGHPVVAKADVNCRTKQDTQQETRMKRKSDPESVAMATADVTKTHASSDRSHKHTARSAPDKTTAVTSSKKRPQYDAVSVPNTQTFTSC